MIEYKTQKKERYYSEIIRLYTEFAYSVEHISLIFSLSYGTVKFWSDTLIFISGRNWLQVVLDLRAKNVHRYHVGFLYELLGVTKWVYYKYDEKKFLNKVASEESVIQFVSGVREHIPVLAKKFIAFVP